MNHVLIAGPEQVRTFLDNLAQAVAGADANIVCRYGLGTPSEYPDWHKTTTLVAFGLPCSDSDMSLAPGLRAIVTPSLGYEGIDVDAASRREIAFANGRVTENFESVAEAAMLFILTALYRLRDAEDRLARGEIRSGPARARMLKGKKVGLVGYGHIARSLIERLQGWGTHILVANRSALAPSELFEQCDLATLLAQSDILLPLVPLTDETENLISRERLLAMKPGCILINLSRGGIVDEAALADPAVHGRLGTIGLDVFVTEPLPLDSALRELPDRILTNHEISHTQENLGALFAMAVANIRAAIAGRPLPTAFSTGEAR